MYDVIIIGAGPAGISASLYTKRANLKTLVLYYGESQLEHVPKIENYYGFVDGISGKELYNSGIEQAKKIGVEIINEQVTEIKSTDDLIFEVKTPNNEYVSKTIIIATGNKKIEPNIKGIKELEGKGVSYCAICDGFFFRDKNVAVIGNGEFAISEANNLKNVVKEITILTNGENPKFLNNEYNINTKKIKEICGIETVNKVIFEDNTSLDISGIFVALGNAGGYDFAKMLGIALDGENIKINENMETNIKGIFACGNLTGGLLQVNKAVYEGAKAGLSVVQELKSN